MKLMVVGSESQVGSELVTLLETQGIDFVAFDSDEQLFIDQRDIAQLIQEHQPDFLINSTLYPFVDRAEAEIERCRLKNLEIPRALAKACSTVDIPMLHLTSPYLFDGDKVGPYTEKDVPNPVNLYGEIHQTSEEAVSAILEKHIILRLGLVFSSGEDNFVGRVLDHGGQDERMEVIGQQLACPTSACSAAEVILAICKQLSCEINVWGIYHYCDVEAVTRREFLEAVIEEAERHPELNARHVEQVSSSQHKGSAKRPMNAVLNCQKLLYTFGIKQRSWRVELAKVVVKLADRRLKNSEPAN
ncbi:SDR family oxidoreductase [Litoribrevibacter albus]|uniref:dTDP-4-dehydrorhamnose reductase n=1 Tax=Litoribrevibacter albus TaxID=1473156 RepID=A0AA37S992_9GAMM|nr:sugar nucleotide-binding protein [Litoribrevibacter albus]GLQ30497.1 NAD(P)-dependent oxidoreductase [Litoribrevibacter albus]